jgi:hypothetical protein
MSFSENEYWYNRTYLFSFDKFELCEVNSVHATYKLAEGRFFGVSLAKENGGQYLISTGLEKEGSLIISIHCQDRRRYYQVWL